MASTDKLFQENGLNKDVVSRAEKIVKGPQIAAQVPAYGKYTGVRATLNNMGFDNGRISYDEGAGVVTLDGKPLLKPGYLDDDAGVSYADPKEIQASVTRYFKDSKNPVVRVSDAFAELAGSYGLSADALGYSDGMASIGGVPLDTLYTDSDGKAWAYRDAVQEGVDRYAKQLGVKSPNSLLDSYNETYLPQIERILTGLENRAPFDYDPEFDPVFQAYRQKYNLEGSRASENAMAGYMGLTGGLANSAAATAGAQARQYYAQQLTNVIPGLAQQAYARYVQQFSDGLGLANQLLDVYNDAYSHALNANNQTLKNANDAVVSNNARDQAAFERYWKELFNKQEYQWTNDKNNNDFWWSQIFNQQKKDQNDQAYQSGALEQEEMERYLRDYYDALMKNEVKGGSLDNAIRQETINNMRYERQKG